MEPIGVFLDGEWDCSRKMFAAQELEFAPQYLDLSQLLIGQDEEANFDIDHSKLGPAFEANISMSEANENLFYSSDALNYSSMECLSQQRSFHDNIFFVTKAHQSCPVNTHSINILASDQSSMYMDTPSVQGMYSFSSSLADMMMQHTARLNEGSNGDAAISPKNQQGLDAIPQNQMTLKRKLEVQELPGCAEYKNKISSVNHNKKSRVSRNVKRTERNARAKDSQKQIPNANREKEVDAAISRAPCYSSCSAEEDSASLEMNGGVISSSNASAAIHSNGKTQSLYARKRRERINERLRILQNLVPNGTKIDISTMLEEAVHYVKFLQLQIKLLSSNDLWMYAPIAYNGIDMGLTRNMKIYSLS